MKKILTLMAVGTFLTSALLFGQDTTTYTVVVKGAL